MYFHLPNCTLFPSSSCTSCGARTGHYSTCLAERRLKEEPVSRNYSGSEIAEEDAPCSDCMGYYQHDLACGFNQPKSVNTKGWVLTHTTCRTCYAINGHRATCPYKEINTVQ